MDLFDRLALASRKYQPRRSAVSGKIELPLDELLRIFSGKTILEMEIRQQGKAATRYQHARGRPVSLIDGIAEIGGSNSNWYEVMETAPSGDYARVRITAHPAGGRIAMLVGRRTPDHVPAEDALLDHLQSRQAQA